MSVSLDRGDFILSVAVCALAVLGVRAAMAYPLVDISGAKSKDVILAEGLRVPNSVVEQMPPVNLPELMKAFDGTEVKSIADWEQKRRPEILDFFTKNMHGIRPVERPEGLAFTPLEADREMLNGKVIRKHAKISFKGPRGDWSFNVVAFLPDRKSVV